MRVRRLLEIPEMSRAPDEFGSSRKLNFRGGRVRRKSSRGVRGNRATGIMEWGGRSWRNAGNFGSARGKSISGIRKILTFDFKES